MIDRNEIILSTRRIANRQQLKGNYRESKQLNHVVFMYDFFLENILDSI